MAHPQCALTYRNRSPFHQQQKMETQDEANSLNCFSKLKASLTPADLTGEDALFQTLHAALYLAATVAHNLELDAGDFETCAHEVFHEVFCDLTEAFGHFKKMETN